MKNAWTSLGLGATLIVLLTIVAYLPALRGGFIWDDDDHFTNNPAMLSGEGLKLIWSSLAVSRYYPLTLTNFWLQRRVWGLNPLPYHLVNIALHAINGVLVFLVLRGLRIRAAWWAAMLWAVHPVNVESVAWITELKNVQSGLFFFLALLCFLRFEPTSNRRWYFMSLLCGAAAMLSKPSTVVLPLVLLLCAWWQHGRLRPGEIARVVPFFIMALAMSLLTITEQSQHVRLTGSAGWSLGIAERWIIAGKAVWFYSVKALWPANLMFVYPRWQVNVATISDWIPLVGLAAVGTILWIWRRQALARACLFGFGFFVIALLPVLGFFDIFYFCYSFVADHFQYLACIGLITLGVSSGAAISQRSGRWGRDVGALVATSVLLLLGASTWRQTHIYHDLETLWRDTLAKNPDACLAHNNLGTVLEGLGNVSEAKEHYEQALKLKPDYTEAHYNLGGALAQLGKLSEAIEQYEQALRLKPDFAEAHYNLGDVLARLGKVSEAIDQYEQGLKIRPDYAKARYHLGGALARLGKLSEAIEQYEQALRLQPDYTEAHYSLAVALEQRGKTEDAIEHYEEALRLRPDSAGTHNSLGKALLREGNLHGALAHFEEALKLSPDSAEVQNNLAWVLVSLAPTDSGDPARAVTLAERACKLTSNQVAAYLDTLGTAYAAMGRFDKAIASAQKAIELARSVGPPELVAEIQNHLELYRGGNAYRPPNRVVISPHP